MENDACDPVTADARSRRVPLSAGDHLGDDQALPVDIPALRALLDEAGLPELEAPSDRSEEHGSLWRAGSDPDWDLPIISERGFSILMPAHTTLIGSLVNAAPALLCAAEERDRLRNLVTELEDERELLQRRASGAEHELSVRLQQRDAYRERATTAERRLSDLLVALYPDAPPTTADDATVGVQQAVGLHDAVRSSADENDELDERVADLEAAVDIVKPPGITDLASILRRHEHFMAVCGPRPVFVGVSPYTSDFYNSAPEDLGALAAEVVRLTAHLHAIGAHPDFEYGISPDRNDPFFAGWRPNPHAAGAAEPNAVHDRWFWMRRKETQ